MSEWGAPVEGTILSNRYLVAEEIGTGGMSNVYRATDLRTGGPVAIKIPHAFLTRNTDFMQRLRREAQIAASLSSPRVVRVIDLDVHDGTPFLVMEYVPGETLHDLINRRGRLTLPESLTVMLEVARALEAAHARGIIHRDLKPRNIKVVDGEIKVLDFGIAKSESFSQMTAASVFMGTPEYCAPERSEGPGDIRSDIYSLGIIFFEMHEGYLPFQALTPIAIMRKHETAPLPPLSGELPGEVINIVARCLAKDADDRYQTPTELVQALRGVLHGDPEGPLLAAMRRLTEHNEDDPSDLTPTVTTDWPHLTGESLQGVAGATSEGAAVTAVPVVAGESPAPQAPVAPPATEERDRPVRRTAPVMLLVAVAAVVLIGAAAVVIFALGRDGDGDPGRAGVFPSATVGAGGPSPSAAPPGTPAPSPSAGGLVVARPLAPVGERVALRVPAVELPTGPQCPGVATILQIMSFELDASGRAKVGYTVEAARVSGTTCVIEYPPDADCRCVVLQTRKPSGRVVESRNTGGSGIAVTGSSDIYGQPPFSGEWWFDAPDLDGDELVLVRLVRDSDAIFFRLPLIRR